MVTERSLRLQATKSMWWMPRCQEAKKDAGGCEKPRGAANQASIRGCPNGKTQPGAESGYPCLNP